MADYGLGHIEINQDTLIPQHPSEDPSHKYVIHYRSLNNSFYMSVGPRDLDLTTAAELRKNEVRGKGTMYINHKGNLEFSTSKVSTGLVRGLAKVVHSALKEKGLEVGGLITPRAPRRIIR